MIPHNHSQKIYTHALLSFHLAFHLSPLSRLRMVESGFRYSGIHPRGIDRSWKQVPIVLTHLLRQAMQWPQYYGRSCSKRPRDPGRKDMRLPIFIRHWSRKLHLRMISWISELSLTTATKQINLPFNLPFILVISWRWKCYTKTVTFLEVPIHKTIIIHNTYFIIESLRRPNSVSGCRFIMLMGAHPVLLCYFILHGLN